MPDPSAADALFERFRRWLRDRHLPVTQQRDRIARAVFESREHLSVEAIGRRVAAGGHAVGTATIYRVLDLLVASGLVRVHDFGEGFRRYESVEPDRQHGHLICVRCGGVTEFATERFERLLPIVADEYGFQPHRHRVEVLGLCRACRSVDLGSPADAAAAPGPLTPAPTPSAAGAMPTDTIVTSGTAERQSLSKLSSSSWRISSDR